MLSQLHYHSLSNRFVARIVPVVMLRAVRVLAVAALAALLAASCCPPNCPPPGPGAGGKGNGGNDNPHGKDKISPPIIVEPLYDCGLAVSVKGFIPGATIDIFAGATRIGGGASETPWGQSFAVSPQLATGQVITATQTFGSSSSGPSPAITVTSYFAAHPEGLPKPSVRAPAYQCGGAVGVGGLAAGGKLDVFEDAAPAASVLGCGAGQWTFVSPVFSTGQKVTATETLCAQTGPRSEPVPVEPAPTSLGTLTMGDMYEGGKYANAYGITNGAEVTVMDGASRVAGHACAGGGQVFRLVPVPAVGASLTATQALCSVVSPPSTPVHVQPCSALPAPKLAPTCVGATTATVVGHAPDARIRIFAGSTLIADGGGPVLNLLRPLVTGDSLTVTQSSVVCTSPPSPPLVVGRACGIPDFAPAFWNDHGIVQNNNNCYNYSNNKRTDTFAQPGTAAGISLGSFEQMRCDDVLAAAEADGLQPSSRSAKCPCSKAKLALVVAPEQDYHWYRMDSDGKWSHKPGNGEATNLDNSGNAVLDPENANRGPYSDFCGYFCACSDREQGQGHENIQ